MKTDEEINAWLEGQDIRAITPQGYPSAFVGVQEIEDMQDETEGAPDEPTHRAVYSRNRIIDILVKRDGMGHEEALEFFEFNIGGAHMDGGPVYITTP